MFLRISAALALAAASVLGAPAPYFAPALQSLQNARNQHYYVEIFGDSLSTCYQAGAVAGNLSGSCPGVGVTAQASLWTYSLGLRLKELYGDGGSGLVPIASEIFGTGGATSSQWSLGPYYLLSNVGPYQATYAGYIGTLFAFAPGSNPTVVGLQGETVRVYYGVGPDSQGGFHAIIDGVDRGIAGTDGYSGNFGAAVASFNVGQGIHTLQIVPVAGHVYIWAAEGKNSKGVSILNASFGSAKSQCFGQSASQFAFHDLIPATEIPLGFAMYGKNEWYSAAPPSQMTQWLTFLINHEQQRNPQRILALIDEPYSGLSSPSSYQQNDYVAATSSAATATGVYHMMLVQNAPFTSYATEAAAGLIDTGDETHLNNAGQHVMGDWILESILDPATISAPVSEWVHIVSRNSGKCLDVFGGPASTQAFEFLDQWDCWGGSNQTFRMDPVGGGYEITAQNSGLQLDILGGPAAVANGVSVIQYAFWGGSNETWKVTPTGDGFFLLSPMSSGKNLDVSGQATWNGAKVWQWDPWGGDNQQWALIAAN